MYRGMLERMPCHKQQTFAGLSQFLNIFSESSVYAPMVHNFRRPLRICAMWCTTFRDLCEYVTRDEQLSEASADMCQVEHNFQRPLKICAKWCTTFGGFCEFVSNGAYIHCPLRMCILSLSA